MGDVIKARDLPAIKQRGITRLIFYCQSNHKQEDQAISINIEMAKKLSNIKANRRTMRLEQCFQQVLATLPDDVLIKDFDVMFNPAYAVDVLQIMCSAARSKSFRVVWPGRYENGQLIYAEEGYRDYKVFEISKYDITVVV